MRMRKQSIIMFIGIVALTILISGCTETTDNPTNEVIKPPIKSIL